MVVCGWISSVYIFPLQKDVSDADHFFPVAMELQTLITRHRQLQSLSVSAGGVTDAGFCLSNTNLDHPNTQITWSNAVDIPVDSVGFV